MNFHIMTLFPEMVTECLSSSIIGRAKEKGLIGLNAVNIRDYSNDTKHHNVDDYTYGGGAGMLMQAQPIYDAWCAVKQKCDSPARTIYLTPQAPVFHQAMAKELAEEEKESEQEQLNELNQQFGK